MNVEEKLNTAFAAHEYLMNELSLKFNDDIYDEADDIFTKISKVAKHHGVNSIELTKKINEYISKVKRYSKPESIRKKLVDAYYGEAKHFKFEDFDEFEDVVDRIGIHGKLKKMNLLSCAKPAPQNEYQEKFLAMLSRYVGKSMFDAMLVDYIYNNFSVAGKNDKRRFNYVPIPAIRTR